LDRRLDGPQSWSPYLLSYPGSSTAGGGNE